MAYTNSKNCYASASGTYCYVLSVSWDREPNQNIPENFSTVKATASLYADRISFDSIDTYKLEIGWTDDSGNTSFSSKNNITFKSLNMYGTKTVSATFRVYHKNDGTLKGYATAKWHCPGTSGGYTPYGTQSISTSNITFTPIPRASSFGEISGSTIGGNITVNINRHSNSFTHSLWFHHEKMQWQGIGSDIGTSKTFTLPMNVCNCFPDTTGGNISLILRTYSNGKQIGDDQWKTIWVNVPGSVAPSLNNPTASRVDNGVPSNWGVYVQGYSKVTVAIPGASGSYGSTIKSYRITGPNMDSWNSSATSSALQNSGTNTYTCTVTDSRGRTASKNVSISVQAYYSPSIAVDAKRCSSDGAINSNGSHLKVTVDYNIASVSGKNAVSSKSASCNGVSNTTFSDATPFILAANCSIGSTYVLTARVTDTLGGKASASINVSTSERVMNVKANKKGIAFGKFAQYDDMADFGWVVKADKGLQSNGPSLFNDRVDVKEDLVSSSISSNIITGDNFEIRSNTFSGQGKNDAFLKMFTIKILTTYVNTPLEICYSQRGCSTPTRIMIKFKSYSELDPDLDHVLHIGDTKGLYMVKEATSLWAIYMRKSEAWEGVDNFYILKPKGCFYISYIGANASSVPSGYRTSMDYYANKFYPVGAIYLTYDNHNPQNFLGGTWVRFGQGRTLIGEGTGNDGGQSKSFGGQTTGGEYAHKLNNNELPNHYHNQYVTANSGGSAVRRDHDSDGSCHTYPQGTTTGGSGGNQAHNNIQPYITVYFWRRTA